MLSKRTLVIIISFVVLFLAILFFYYVFQPTKSLVKVKPDYVISANELFADFEEDESKANTKYLGKVLEVKGKVRELDISADHISIIMETNDVFGGINCSLATEKFEIEETIVPGTIIKIKGECSGKLMDVMLTNCVIVSFDK